MRYLIGLVLEDEMRHHRVLLEMANTVKRDIGWNISDSSIPHELRSNREKLLNETTRYLDSSAVTSRPSRGWRSSSVWDGTMAACCPFSPS